VRKGQRRLDNRNGWCMVLCMYNQAEILSKCLSEQGNNVFKAFCSNSGAFAHSYLENLKTSEKKNVLGMKFLLFFSTSVVQNILSSVKYLANYD
jgi:hypothetical protein